MDITTIGFDLAKTVFQVHGADGEGRPVLRRKLRRGKVLAFFAGLPSCLVGMEACASAHYWARELQALGHKVRLIPPQYVRPFVKTNKNDAADAEAICEAVTRPTMRFFATKRRDCKAALKILKRTMKRYGRPQSIVTDRLRSYRAAMKVVGVSHRQECGRWLNNRAEDSHQPFRRREGATARFRDIKTLQKFATVHASIHNRFNLDRHLNRRDIFKQNRSVALAEWRQLAA